jgi:hypothetical protein
MTRSGTGLASAAVIALTMGVVSRADLPAESETRLPPESIILAAEDGAADAGQTEETDSAKMGKEDGTQEGAALGDAPESESDKVDQPDRGDKTAGAPADSGGMPQ